MKNIRKLLYFATWTTQAGLQFIDAAASLCWLITLWSLTDKQQLLQTIIILELAAHSFISDYDTKTNLLFNVIATHITLHAIRNCILTIGVSTRWILTHTVSDWSAHSSESCLFVVYSDAELFKLLQVVVERLDVRKHTHGVRLVPHLHHVLHLDQTEAVGLLPET